MSRDNNEDARLELGTRAANSQQQENQAWTAKSKIARDLKAADKEGKESGK